MQHSIMDIATPPVPDARQRRSLRVEYCDLLTVACEPAVLQTVENTFPSGACAVVHAHTLTEALAYLRYNLAAVALVQTAASKRAWQNALLELQSCHEAPEVIMVGQKDVSCSDLMMWSRIGIVVPPLDSATLLDKVSSAWHRWLSRHGTNGIERALCSRA